MVPQFEVSWAKEKRHGERNWTASGTGAFEAGLCYSFFQFFSHREYHWIGFSIDLLSGLNLLLLLARYWGNNCRPGYHPESTSPALHYGDLGGWSGRSQFVLAVSIHFLGSESIMAMLSGRRHCSVTIIPYFPDILCPAIRVWYRCWSKLGDVCVLTAKLPKTESTHN